MDFRTLIFAISIALIFPHPAKSCSDIKQVAQDLSRKMNGDTALFFGEFHDVAESRQTILRLMKDFGDNFDCFAFEAFTIEDKATVEKFEQFIDEKNLDSRQLLEKVFPIGSFWDSDESDMLFIEVRKRKVNGKLKVCPFNRAAPEGFVENIPSEVPAAMVSKLKPFAKNGKWHPEQIRSSLMATTLANCLMTCSNSLVVIGSMHAARMSRVKNGNRLDVVDLYSQVNPNKKLTAVFDARIHDGFIPDNADLVKLNERNRDSKCAKLVRSSQLVGADEKTKQVQQLFDFAIVGDLANQIQSSRRDTSRPKPAPARAIQ